MAEITTCHFVSGERAARDAPDGDAAREEEAVGHRRPQHERGPNARIKGKEKLFQKHHVRGNIAQEVYELSNSAASCSRSSFNALYESHACPLSFAVWQPDLLPEAAE